MNTLKSYRHGDLALKGINNLPEGLKASKSKVIMQGSGGHDHSFNNGTLYLKKENDFVIGYLEAKDTKLFHLEHGKKVEGKTLKEAKIKDGYYQLLKQNEARNGELRPVVD